MNSLNNKLSSDINENEKIMNLILYSKDSEEIAQTISNLLNGLDLNYKNEIGDTLLMIAARKNMKKITTVIIEYLTNNMHFNYLNNQNNEGENILMILVKRNSFDLFEKLAFNENTKIMLNHKTKNKKDVSSLAKDYGYKNILDIINLSNSTKNTMYKKSI